jgi:hypothetical protein
VLWRRLFEPNKIKTNRSRPGMKALWKPHNWLSNTIGSLTKGFSLFYFLNKVACDKIISCSSQVCRNTLVFPRWYDNLCTKESAQLCFPMWVEFPGLPMQLWPFLNLICKLLHGFTYHGPKWVLKIDLFENLKEYVLIRVGNKMFKHNKMLNTFFRCHNPDHKIRNCPPMAKYEPSHP